MEALKNKEVLEKSKEESKKENKRLYLASPHMGELEQVFVKEAFDTNWVAPLGPNVNNFEKEMCEYTGANSATALVSGTSAIHLALKCLGVGQGDVVFCSTLTFSAIISIWQSNIFKDGMKKMNT